MENSLEFPQKVKNMGVWVAQSVKHVTYDFGSSHDLMDCGIEPHVGSVPSGKSV